MVWIIISVLILLLLLVFLFVSSSWFLLSLPLLSNSVFYLKYLINIGKKIEQWFNS